MPKIFLLLLCATAFAARMHSSSEGTESGRRPKALEKHDEKWADLVPDVLRGPTSILRSVLSFKKGQHLTPLEYLRMLTGVFESKGVLYCIGGKFTNVHEQLDEFVKTLPPETAKEIQKTYELMFNEVAQSHFDRIIENREDSSRAWDQMATQYAHTPAGNRALIKAASGWMDSGRNGISIVYAEELWRSLPKENPFGGFTAKELLSLARIYGQAGNEPRFSTVWAALKPFLGTDALTLGTGKVLEEKDRARFLRPSTYSLKSELMELALSPDKERRELFRRVVRHIPADQNPLGDSLCPLLEAQAAFTSSEPETTERTGQINLAAQFLAKLGWGSFDFLKEVYKKGDPERKLAAVWAIHEIVKPHDEKTERVPAPEKEENAFRQKGISFLLDVAEKGSPAEKSEAVAALFNYGASSKLVVPLLVAAIDDPTAPHHQRVVSARVLANYSAKERGLASMKTLETAMGLLSAHNSIDIPAAILAEIYRQKGKESFPELISKTVGPDYSATVLARRAIVALGDEIAPTLLHAFKTGNLTLKRELVGLLGYGKIGRPEEVIRALLTDLDTTSDEKNRFSAPPAPHTGSLSAEALKRRMVAQEQEERKQYSRKHYRSDILLALGSRAKQSKIDLVPALGPLLYDPYLARNALSTLMQTNPKMPQSLIPQVLRLVADRDNHTEARPDAEKWMHTLDDHGASVFLAGLNNPDEEIRAASARGLRRTRSQSPEVIQTLIQHLKDPFRVQEAVTQTLVKIPQGKQALIEAMKNDDSLREVGLETFSQWGFNFTKADIPTMENFLLDKSPRVRQMAAHLILEKAESEKATQTLIEIARSAQLSTRKLSLAGRKPTREEDIIEGQGLSAIRTLQYARVQSKAAYSFLLSMAKDPNAAQSFRLLAREALPHFDGDPVIAMQLLKPGLSDKDHRIRMRTLRAIEQLRENAQPLEKDILALTKDQHTHVRSYAAQALAIRTHLSPETRAALTQMYWIEKEPTVVTAIMDALLNTEANREARKRLLAELRSKDKRSKVLSRINRRIEREE